MFRLMALLLETSIPESNLIVPGYEDKTISRNI